MTCPPQSGREKRAAFTLIEVILSVLLFSLLAGAIFGFASGAIQLGQSVEERTQKEAEHADLVDFLGDWLDSLPPDAQIQWDGSQFRAIGATTLPLGGQNAIPVRLSEINLREDGAVVLRWGIGSAPQEIALSENWEDFQWRAKSRQLPDWQPKGASQGLPRLLELRYQPKDGLTRRHIFSFPPRAVITNRRPAPTPTP